MKTIADRGWWLAIGTLLLVASAEVRASDHDFEWWTWETVTIDLPDDWGINDSQLWLEHVNRFDQDLHNHLRWHGSIGLLFPLPGLESWSLLPAYRRMTNNVNTENENHEDRWQFDLFRTWENIFSTGWDLKYRTRLDIRDEHSRDDITYRIRPMFTLSHSLPLEIHSEPVRFFVFEEINYDFEADRWNRRRFGLGLALPVKKNINLTLGYMVESNWQETGWDHDSILLTGIDLKF